MGAVRVVAKRCAAGVVSMGTAVNTPNGEERSPGAVECLQCRRCPNRVLEEERRLLPQRAVARTG